MGGQRQGHQARALMLPAYYIDRMMPVLDGCVLWLGYVNPYGYGLVLTTGQFRLRLAHSAVWELTHGPVPDGLQLDHLCRVKSCVNVDHLEVVTQAVNMRRRMGMPDDGATCSKGHRAWKQDGNGHRRCRTCQNAYARARYGAA